MPLLRWKKRASWWRPLAEPELKNIIMEAGLVEMAFSFGVVLAIAFWQLWTVRPGKDKHKEKKQDSEDRTS